MSITRRSKNNKRPIGCNSELAGQLYKQDGYKQNKLGRNDPVFLVREQNLLVGLCMQEYKSSSYELCHPG